ncbi:xanthine dehydrogenase family protein molybdopterin-binding subunit [Candidatus Hecatella orcuttiae]|uniref:xanthine dehydrogenase family protein molybdopterin-binding subunit n=1 Tax=Candidatus Hecatella orcuttiae TaxID=1935119 RepID=UPI00286801E0|nr:xanthine dehydrogenase family protein molybdopterin-binding subunit [Candidatus Hecatella orcuttiae]
MSEKELSVVGKPLPKIDAYEKAVGKARYTVDLNLPGMLHAKILRSPYAHARILKIDTSKAERLPGVKAVLSHKEARIILGDEAVLDDKVRYVGDKVAAVAATSEEAAEEALELIEVKYEVLPAVFDPEEAMKPEAPIIHPDVPLVKGKGNLRDPVFDYGVGDVEKGFKEADYVFENRYTTQRQAHCCLEPDVGIASWDPSGKLTYWTSVQGAFIVRGILARGLNMPENMIRVIVPPVGGGFGAKYGRLEDVLCALLAKKTGRPVKLECSREEEFVTTRVRSYSVFWTKTGVKKDGTFTARYVRAIIDMGAYAYGIYMAQRAGAWLITPYSCPNCRYEGYAVYTNTPSSGAFRGFSSVPIHFALESEINRIAEELGIDPLEFRMKNRRKTGEINPYNNVPIDAKGFDECMVKGAERIGWRRKRGRREKVEGVKRRGVGMAISVHFAPALHPDMLVPGVAEINVNADGTIHLLIGVTDIGQGINTTCAQIAAEELGVRLEDVTVSNIDTDVNPWGWLVAASSTLMQTGGAVRAAAAKVKKQLFEHAAKMLEVPPEELEAKDRRIYVKKESERGIEISDVIRQAGAPSISPYFVDAKAAYTFGAKATYTVPMYIPPWGAQFAEIEVDTETGQVKVLRLVAAHDVGKAINVSIVEGQIEGSLQNSIGYALTEELMLDKTTGQVLNPDFLDYKILHTTDMPKIDVILVETNSPAGVFGAKGVGEMGHIPTAAAIADAVYDAVGVRIKELPLTPEKILKALRER